MRRLKSCSGFELVVDFEEPDQVRRRLKKPIAVNVSFDAEASKIVIYQPDAA